MEELIKKQLKEQLSEKRYMHSLGVMERAEQLAEIYGEDIEKCRLVGLVHDIAKEMSKEEMLKYVKENNIKIDEVEEQNVGLLHAKIGAHICKTRYNFSKEMQDAIIYHTVGNINMDKLAKIIYVADKTEKSRKATKERQMICDISNINIDRAIIDIIGFSIKKSIDEKKLIHPDSIILRNSLLMQELNK